MLSWSTFWTRGLLPYGLLTANAFLSIKAMWGMIYQNGYLAALLRLTFTNAEHATLPGSNLPILRRYTGVPILDRMMVFTTLLFANTTDGSWPPFTLFCFDFSGQLAAIETAIFIECGSNSGNHYTALLWLTLMQLSGYGFVMPMYCIADIWSRSQQSPQKRATAHKDVVLASLPRSVLVGNIIPTLAMGLPTRNNYAHQRLSALWQFHPLWIASAWFYFRKRFAKADQHSTNARERAYAFAFGAAAFTHLGTLGVIGAKWMFPELLPVQAQQTLTLASTYWPPSFHSHAPIKSMAKAGHALFQYDLYCGSLASIIWALTLYTRSRKTILTVRQCVVLASKLGGICALAGPSAAAVFLLWYREDRVDFSTDGKDLGMTARSEKNV